MNSDVNSILEINTEIKSNKTNIVENKIANILKSIGIITIFIGVVAGLIVGMTLSIPEQGYKYITEPHPLRWVYGITLIVSSFVSGMMFIGFGEIIRLLDRIDKKTNSIEINSMDLANNNINNDNNI